MPDFLDDQKLVSDLSEKFSELDKIDVGNLLAEEVEKSRTWFLGSSLASVTAMVFGVDTINFFGTKIEINEDVALYAYANLVAITFFLGVYFLINAISSSLAKYPKRALAKAIVASATVMMLKNDDSVSEGQDTASESLKLVHSRTKDLFSEFERGFETQLRVMAVLPWAIFIVCNTITVAGFISILPNSVVCSKTWLMVFCGA